MELPWFHGLDDAALEATLRSLEGCGGDDHTPVDPADSPPFAWLLHKTDSDVKVSVNPQAPLQVQLRFSNGESDHTSTGSQDANEPVASASRGRRKRLEVQSLREQVTVLESTIAELTQSQETQLAQQQGGDRTTSKVVNSAWESMASRQRSQLRRSQAENRKLRRAVEEYDRVADQLQRLIQLNEERVKEEGLSSMHPKRIRSATDSQDTAMLESLTEVLPSMYHRTDAVLSDPRLAKLAAHFCEVNVERGPDSLAIQRLDSRIVPFDFEATSNAVWRNLMDRLASESQPQGEELPDDTRRAHFISHMRIAGFDGYATCYMALRRIVEPDRVIFVRSSVFIYIDEAVPDSRNVKNLLEEEAGNADVKRVVLGSSPIRHFLWMIVTRPDDSALQGASDPSQLTQIRSSSISLPSIIGQSEAQISVTTKFYSEISRQMHLQSQEEVDNLLLGSAASERLTHRGIVPVAPCFDIPSPHLL